MIQARSSGGFSLLELVVVVGLMAFAMTLVAANWQGHVALQRLRYGTAQVASDLREAQERAKADRVTYTVTFTASSSTYVIARSGGGFAENAQLPSGVTAQASTVVTFTAFGKPDAAHAIAVQSSAGTGNVSLNATGGITYQEP